MKNILVVGGAGYIGSHTCKMLAQQGFRPVVLDNLVYGHAQAVRWGPLHQGDLFDQALLRRVIEQEKIEAVLHFAAYAYVGESVRDPLKYYHNNVAGTLSLLQVCQEKKIHRLVFSSTCATYGVPERVPIDEDCAQNPINPYGQSKLMIEKVLRDLCAASPFRATALRYFNAAGADLDAEIGEDHNPETHLIPLIFRAATDAGQPLTVFGRDYPTPDGTCIRDYIHVNDLASAHILALQKMDAMPEPFSVFNLGTGQGYSVAEVLKEAETIVGRPIPHLWGERRPGDPAKLVAAGQKAKSVLGWKPAASDLRTILSSAWKWHQTGFGAGKKT